MRVLAVVAIICGCLFVYGFLIAERVRITTLDDRATGFNVLITLNDIKPEDRWIEVYGCSAEFLDETGYRCTQHWERRSTQQPRMDQRQYEFRWGRYVPRGPILIAVVVFDDRRRVRVSGQTVVLR